MPGMPVGPAGKREELGAIKGKTAPLTATPAPGTTGIEYFQGDGISFELRDAPAVCVPTSLSKISYEEMQVLGWLRTYRSQIIAAETEFNVDRRAIAAAIAWEALKNVWSFSVHAVGPGKPHTWRSDSFLWLPIAPEAWLDSVTDEGTWVKQVEDAHILPNRSFADRNKLLRTPSGAIQYIGAIMDLIATIYEENGSPGVCDLPIRKNPVILTNEYQGSDANKWKARMKTIKPDEPLTGPKQDPDTKSMAVWISKPRNLQYIEDAVGPTEVRDSPSKGQDAGACTSDYRDATSPESARILEKAKAYEGTPYKYGGASKDGIDCSHHVWKSINDALPNAHYEYMATDGLDSVPWLRKLKTDESPVSGDVVLFDHHVGFYDQNPDKPGYTLYSARGDQTRSTPGVTSGMPAWFGAKSTLLRVRVPCK